MREEKIKKKIKNIFLFCLIKKKKEKKENIIILNDLFIINQYNIEIQIQIKLTF